jgi:hypothetical protein
MAAVMAGDASAAEEIRNQIRQTLPPPHNDWRSDVHQWWLVDRANGIAA